MDIKKTLKKTWIVGSEFSMATVTYVGSSIMRTAEYTALMMYNITHVYGGMVSNIKEKFEELESE